MVESIIIIVGDFEGSLVYVHNGIKAVKNGQAKNANLVKYHR